MNVYMGEKHGLGGRGIDCYPNSVALTLCDSGLAFGLDFNSFTCKNESYVDYV